jgi:hypothetical protein
VYAPIAWASPNPPSLPHHHLRHPFEISAVDRVGRRGQLGMQHLSLPMWSSNSLRKASCESRVVSVMLNSGSRFLGDFLVRVGPVWGRLPADRVRKSVFCLLWARAFFVDIFNGPRGPTQLERLPAHSIIANNRAREFGCAASRTYTGVILAHRITLHYSACPLSHIKLQTRAAATAASQHTRLGKEPTTETRV